MPGPALSACRPCTWLFGPLFATLHGHKPVSSVDIIVAKRQGRVDVAVRLWRWPARFAAGTLHAANASVAPVAGSDVVGRRVLGKNVHAGFRRCGLIEGLEMRFGRRTALAYGPARPAPASQRLARCFRDVRLFFSPGQTARR